MIDQSELNSRAALCRRLAQREPANRTFWMAEADNWTRMSKAKPRGEAGEAIVKNDCGIPMRLRRNRHDAGVGRIV
jgi:hypothetical protein